MSTSKVPLALRDTLTQAYMEQAHIGWHHGIKGFLTTTWNTLASVHPYYPHRQPQPQHGHSRIFKILRNLHYLSKSLWIGRNQALHNAQNRKQTSRLNLESELIREYYSDKHKLLPGDQHHCQGGLTAILNSSPNARRRWIRRVKSAQLRNSIDGLQQTAIFQYFKSTNNRQVNQSATQGAASIAHSHSAKDPMVNSQLEIYPERAPEMLHLQLPPTPSQTTPVTSVM